MEGTTTRFKTFQSLAPKVWADSTKTLSVLFTPSIVYTKIGKTHPMNMINTAGTVPIPNHKIENGIHATGGIGLKTLITKVHKSSRVLYHPSKIPKGIATTDARIKPENTLNNVSIVFVRSFPF